MNSFSNPQIEAIEEVLNWLQDQISSASWNDDELLGTLRFQRLEIERERLRCRRQEILREIRNPALNNTSVSSSIGAISLPSLSTQTLQQQQQTLRLQRLQIERERLRRRKQKILREIGNPALNVSLFANSGGSSAPAGSTAYGSNGADQYESNQSQYSYGQHPSAFSYSNRALKKMHKDFKSLLDSGENNDVTFVVGGKKFPAHRTILCARSPVIKAMLCHDTIERNSGTVNIDDCDPDSFQDFLTYVYTGSTRHIDTENVISLYTTSDKYLMDELKEACVSFMKANMSVEEFCDIAILALRHEEKELLESLANFFVENAKKMIHSENWVSIANRVFP